MPHRKNNRWTTLLPWCDFPAEIELGDSHIHCLTERFIAALRATYARSLDMTTLTFRLSLLTRSPHIERYVSSTSPPISAQKSPPSFKHDNFPCFSSGPQNRLFRTPHLILRGHSSEVHWRMIMLPLVGSFQRWNRLSGTERSLVRPI